MVSTFALPRAYAQDAKERAAALLQEGVQRRAEGKDEAALLLFRQADELDSTPKSRAQLALAEQSLGMWVIAEKHLRDALAQTDPWIEKNRALLESSLTRIAAELGWIDVVGAPAAAEIFIDGERVGQSPLEAPTRAAAGTRLLEVKAKGYEPYSRRVLVRGGEISRERAAFVPLRPIDKSPTAAAAGGPRFVDVVTPAPLRTVGWIGVGVGAGAAIFGGTSFIIRQNYVDGYNSDERCPGTAAADQPPTCQSQKNGVSRWSTMGVISLVAGGVLVAGGLTLVLISPPTHSKVQVASFSAACSPTLGGFSCGGTFR